MSEPTDDTDDKKTKAGAGADNVVRLDFKRASKPQPAAPGEPQLVAGRGGADEKLRDFTEMIERGMVMVTLDARRFGVRVPPRFAGELELRLNFSLRFQVADFRYDGRGVRASLSFQGTAFFCDVPWTAIYQLRSHVDNQVRLWPDDMPDELIAMIPEAARVLKNREDEKARREAETAALLTTPSAPLSAADKPALALSGPALIEKSTSEKSGEKASEEKPASTEGEAKPEDDPPAPKRPGLRLVKS